MKNVPVFGFAIFLCVYSYFKYTAVPQLMGTPQYITTTAILVVMTAVIPFVFSWFFANQLNTKGRVLTLSILPLLLCGIGLATYFFLFIAPNAPGMSVTQVLPRAIVPGLVMSAILLLPMWMHRTDN